MDENEISNVLQRLHRHWLINDQMPILIQPVATIAQDGRVQLQRPRRPLHAPALNVVGVKVGVIRVLAILILGQRRGDFQEFVPAPSLFGVVAGRFNAGFGEDVGVIVDMRRNPAGADAIPLAILGAALFFLRLDEVIGRAHEFVTFNLIGNVGEQSLFDKSPVAIGADKGRIGRSAGGDVGQQLIVIEFRRVQPGHLDLVLLRLELRDGRFDAFIFLGAAPAHKGDFDGFTRRGGTIATGCRRCTRCGASRQRSQTGQTSRRLQEGATRKLAQRYFIHGRFLLIVK